MSILLVTNLQIKFVFCNQYNQRSSEENESNSLHSQESHNIIERNFQCFFLRSMSHYFRSMSKFLRSQFKFSGLKRYFLFSLYLVRATRRGGGRKRAIIKRCSDRPTQASLSVTKNGQFSMTERSECCV